MAIGHKKILFIFLVALFLFITPLIALYSLGWRLNVKQWKIERPGAFYFKALPRSASVYLNYKLKKKTDFFFGSILIENLSSKKYEVEIKKEGYKDWKKSFQIEEGKVTEAKNILLIPENNQFKPVSSSFKNLYFSKSEKKVALLEEENNSWVLSLFDFAKNEKSILLRKEDLFPTLKSGQQGIELKSLRFSPDDKRMLLELKLSNQAFYYLLDSGSLEYLNLGKVQGVEFNPVSSDRILFLQGDSLYEKAFQTKLIEKNVSSFAVSGSYAYYLDNSGYLYKADSSFFQKEKLSFSPFKGKSPEILIFGDYQFIKDQGNLYQLDKKTRAFNLVFESVSDIDFSRDERKLSLSNGKEIWVLYLKEIQEQPQKKEGEKEFLTRFSEKTGQAFWLTDHYLVFSANNKIEISEIDTRSELNIYEIGEFKNPVIYWNKENKKLFVRDGKELYYLDDLVPWF